MIQTKEKLPLTLTVGVAPAQDFKIVANAFAFKVLMDGMYSDKIWAVVREVISNAWDSHRKSGKSGVPFTVHMPNDFEPFFTVRDFGTSLTHEEMYELYTTLFASSKRETNDEVGAFGLGCKSPFAYAQSFTVTCWLAGEKRVYSCFLNDGMPQISMVYRGESDEPQGLEVTVPVHGTDVAEFTRNGRKMASSVQPTPIGLTAPRNVEEALHLTDNDEVHLEMTLGDSEAGLHIRQGCVVYPVESYVGRSFISYANHQRRIVLDVPIGSISVTASRESLSMDEATRSYLKRIGAKATEMIDAHIESEFAEAEQIRRRLDRMKAYDLWARRWSQTNPEVSIKVRGSRDAFDGTFYMVNGRSNKVSPVVNVTPRTRIWFGDPATFGCRAELKSVFESDTDIIFHGSRKELARAVRVLGVTEVRTVLSLRKPKAPKGKGGASTGPRAKPAPRIWMLYSGATTFDRPDMTSVWIHKHGAADSEKRALVGHTAPVYVLTPSPAAKLVDPENHLTAVLDREMRRPDVVAKIRSEYVDYLVYRRMPWQHQNDLCKAGKVRSGGNEFIGYLTEEEREECSEAAKVLVDEIKSRYPVLFDGLDAMRYIADMDAAAANAPTINEEV